MEHIYFNLFSLGAIITAIFCGMGAVYLFLSVRKGHENRQATLLLAFIFLGTALLNLAYAFAHSYYHPFASFHRWLSFASAMPALAVFNRFLFFFPTPILPRVRNVIFTVELLVALGLCIAFYSVTLNQDHKFFFTGHYWDFTKDPITNIYALSMMGVVVIAISLGIYRIVKLTGKERWVMLAILIGFITASLVPVITNLLSRDGIIDRGIHQFITVITNVTGLFVVLILYINFSKDRTTIMLKIVGITLVTFLVFFQVLGFFYLRRLEKSFDQIYLEKSRNALINPASVDEVQYLLEYDLKGRSNNPDKTYRGPLKEIFKKDSVKINFYDYQVELFGTALYEEIRNPQSDKNDESIKRLLQTAPGEFAGYRAVVEEKLSQKHGREDFLVDLNKLSKLNFVHVNRIDSISAKNFPVELAKYIQAQKQNFKIFSQTINEILLDTRQQPMARQKASVLKALSPIEAQGTRRNRIAEDQRTHYLGYIFYDAKNQKVYEVGYEYQQYRSYLHRPTVELLSILFILTIVVLLFRIFFHGSINIPLAQLIDGVKKVNDGNLHSRISVRVRDEIGFLSESFNSMVASIRLANNQLRRHAEGLEETVTERTRELQNTLNDVEALKNQQDGDYFLTSLLIRPLGSNNAESNLVTIESLVVQKKHFKFRHWQADIGGDINISHSIFLKGSPFTVFINADAMGKSVQGAGGALVLGAVFQSLIQRTKLSSEAQDQYPERWLKNAFIELQKVFESFNGSMLISAVIGLIDDQSGLMYFINAEHPWVVLYRDGNASFLETEMTFRKLGTIGDLQETEKWKELRDDTPLFVRTFQLQEKDVIILGSDGRDDLQIGVTATGEKIINEEENLFLERVREAESDLQKIYENCKRFGEITDDFSLMRIGYKEALKPQQLSKQEKSRQLYDRGVLLLRENNIKEAIANLEQAHEIDETNPEILHELILASAKEKDYQKVASYGEDYIFMRPSETEIVYLTSYCNKVLGNYEKAIDLGERVRLRNPRYLNNLINLADTYLLVKNLTQCEHILEQIGKIDPDNQNAKKILATVNELRHTK